MMQFFSRHPMTIGDQRDELRNPTTSSKCLDDLTRRFFPPGLRWDGTRTPNLGMFLWADLDVKKRFSKYIGYDSTYSHSCFHSKKRFM